MPARARRLGRPGGDVGAVEEHRPGLLAGEAGDHVQQGGLPGAVGADQADDLARRHRNETSSTAMTPPKRTVTPPARGPAGRPRTAHAVDGTGPRAPAGRPAQQLAWPPDTMEAMPSGAWRRSWMARTPLTMASQDSTLSRSGRSVVSEMRRRRHRARPRHRGRRRRSSRCRRSPRTATSRIEPKTLKSANWTLRLAEGEQDAAERGDAGADRERVDLDPDDADARAPRRRARCSARRSSGGRSLRREVGHHQRAPR